MSNSPFPPRLRIMSHLQRWGVMPLLFRDQVASHSWFVAVYSGLVADLISWEGDRARLLMYALLHDLGETATGDIEAPIKQAIVDPSRERAYARAQMARTMPKLLEVSLPYGQEHPDVLAIVRVADRLDATLFCAMEAAFGNGAMGKRLKPCTEELRDAWYKLPLCGWSPEHLGNLWANNIQPALVEHGSAASYDIEDL